MRVSTPEEVSYFETRHILVIRAVRDGSPADMANVPEGDTVLTVNGQAQPSTHFVPPSPVRALA